jgi:hypothetical protein
MTKETIFTINTILTHLPKKIINNRNHDALATCILYEISQEICLHLDNAAYFIYNPDFHLCKGITGIKKTEILDWCNDPWTNITEFENSIKETNYNKSIKNIQFCTVFSNKDILLIIEEIKKSMQLQTEEYFHWLLPNNNIGILLYQSVEKENNLINKEYIENAASLLGFCPIC